MTPMATYTIAWGHSGEQGRHWTTAREASRYAAEEWGTVEAESPEAAVEIVRAEIEAQGGTVGDYYVDGRTIHIIAWMLDDE